MQRSPAAVSALALSLGVTACGQDDSPPWTGPCHPGDRQACYVGPEAQAGVGACHRGVQFCDELGTGFGPCEGYGRPAPEDCWTEVDEDCDGRTPACPAGYPVVDLRADVNRNGTIDLDDPSEDADEDRWDSTHGAIFLANIDDDESACPLSDDDAELAACHDGADEVVNGSADLADLARLRTRPWPDAPDDAHGALEVDDEARPHVRLFRNHAGVFEPYLPGELLSSGDLRQGIEFAIEGKDIVRDALDWDGFADLVLEMESGTGPDGPWPDHSDALRMRLAPVIFRHHLDDAERIYASVYPSLPGGAAFDADLAAAVAAAAVPQGLHRFPDLRDQWTQDFLETAYMSMPSEAGEHVIHVNFRSPNYRGTVPKLRGAGRFVFTELRGEDVAGAVVFDPTHPDEMDSLNSFGNLETIPPFVHGARAWPQGRVLLGSSPSRYSDRAFARMIHSQGVQDAVTIDTQWLHVGHVDETVCFIAADSARKWAMLVADPALSKAMLEAHCDVAAPDQTPHCETAMFVGKWWGPFESAEATLFDVLSDPDVMNESAWAAVEIDDQVQTLTQSTGITAGDTVGLPVLFYPVAGRAVAYQPNTVNSVVFGSDDFGAAVTHGPVIDGEDIFAAHLEQTLSSFGMTVHWIEDWNGFHRYDGDVHCGCNVTRQVPTDRSWWEEGP